MNEKYSDILKRRNKRILLFILAFMMINLSLFAYALLITPQPLPLGFQNEIIVSDLLIIGICIVIVIIFAYFIFILNEWWDYERWDSVMNQITGQKSKEHNIFIKNIPQKCPRCGEQFSGDICICGYIDTNQKD